MLMMLKRLIIFSLFFFLPLANTCASTDDRIRGVSEFLTGRFQENYFYIFELRLKENELFKQYFPATYQYAASGELKFLLGADNGIWENSIEADIKTLATKYMAQFFYSELVNVLISEDWVGSYVNKVREIEALLIVVDNGQATELSGVLTGDKKYSGSNMEVKDFVRIYNDYALPMQKMQTAEIAKSNSIDKIMDSISNVHRQVNELSSFLGKLEKIVLKPETSGLLIKKNKAYKLRDYIDELEVLNVKLEKAARIKQDLQELFEETFKEKTFFDKLAMSLTQFDKKVEKKNIDYVSYVWRLEKIIRDSRQLLGLETDTKEYRRFKQYIFFFAQLSKPQSSEQVKLLLQEVTLPAVSFGIKRERHEHQWLISSYLGYSAGKEISAEIGEADKWFSGLIAPVGIEYNYGFASKSSLSLMYAPFDFAYPINLELQDDNREVSLSDVIVHGIYITYGFANYPVALGLGVSKGKSLRSDERDETRVFLFFAMDMPLFELY